MAEILEEGARVPQPPVQVAVAVADEDGLAARPLVLEQRQVGGRGRVRQMQQPAVTQPGVAGGCRRHRSFFCAKIRTRGLLHGEHVARSEGADADGLLADTGG